jgi:hypothetical protein
MTTERDDDILDEAYVAQWCGCAVETLQQLTPNKIPGVRLGREGYRYVRSQVIKAMADMALEAQGKRAPSTPAAPTPGQRTARNKRRPHPQLRAV